MNASRHASSGSLVDRILANPVFLRTNYVLTWVWAIAFIIEAASGLYGDAVLDNSNNLWTGWIIQTLPLIVAAQFTLWYPDRVQALGAIERGESTDPPPHSRATPS